MLTSVILFILIIMWVVVLVPPYWKNRSVRGGRSLSIGNLTSSSSSSSAPNGLQALSSIQQAPRQPIPTGQGSTVVPFRRPGEPAPTAAMPAVNAAPAPLPNAAMFNNDADMMFGGASRGMHFQAPVSIDDARRRRRNVLIAAFTFSLFLLGAAIQWQGIFTLLFLVSLAVSLGFVMVVVQNQRTSDLQAATVAPLHPVAYQPQPLTAAVPGYVPQARSAN